MLLCAINCIEKDEDREFILLIYNKYHRLIYKKIYDKIKSSKDVEDLVNDTFIRLIEKVDILKTLGERELLYYIVHTSTHIAIDYIKRCCVQRKYTYYGNQDDIHDELAELPEVEYTYDERLEDLAEAITKLPEKDYNLLITKYFFNKTDNEIAATLGIHVNSVRQTLTRARRKAMQLMEKGNGKK